MRLPAALVSLAALTGCAAPTAPPVVLLTDFGLQDDAVGLMRGVIHDIAPRAPIADLTHAVPAFDVAEGARLLADAPGVYPRGSVFCVVVDPGVGTARRALVAELPSGTRIVAPDNGVITLAAERHGPVRVRAITNEDLVRPALSATFHGRDVFAPVAAHLAAGVAFEAVGPAVDDWLHLDVPQPTREGSVLSGRVEAIDRPFGNVWTDLPPSWLTELGVREGQTVHARVGEETLELPWVATFGDVPQGRPLLYVNSRGKLALALNMGDFAARFSVERGLPVHILAGR